MFSANEITSSFPYKRIFNNLFISCKIHTRKAGRPRPLCGGFCIREWKQFVLPSQTNETKQRGTCSPSPVLPLLQAALAPSTARARWSTRCTSHGHCHKAEQSPLSSCGQRLLVRFLPHGTKCWSYGTERACPPQQSGKKEFCLK